MPSEEVNRKLGMLQTLQTVLLCAVVLVLVVMVAVSGFVAVKTERNAAELERVAGETHVALCSLRRGIEIERQSRLKYVADVKAGRRELIEGITLAEIEDGIEGQEDRLRELAILSCEGVK